MKDSLFPTSGGRVVLTLARASETGESAVAYLAALYVPGVCFTTNVTVRVLDGEVSFERWSPAPPPPWLAAFARAFLRSAWLARRDDASEPWPARINRWRQAK